MRSFRLFPGLFPGLLVLWVLAGCQQNPSLLQREGYYSWVDEQGQVRTSRVPVGQQAPEPLPRRRAEPEESRVEVAPVASGQAGADPDTEYNLTNYPDAEALEAAGYVRPGDPLPYFTWRDASGQLQVSDYRPDTRSDVAKGRVPAPLSLTPARVYQAEPSPAAATSRPTRASEALRVLGVEPAGADVFQRWRQDCCRAVTLDDVVPWSGSREFQVAVPEGTPAYAFLSGTSPYRLVRLPDPAESASLVMRLRSFNTQGLFVPSAAFLDGSLQPVRLVTDLVMDYTPESWHRQGYLEALLPAFPARGERWLLLYTTAADLQGQTVVETSQGPRAIPHRQQGLLSVTEMKP